MSGQIEIVGRVSGRRRWTVEQKLLILGDAFGPGGSVRGAIERHEVSSGLLYTWRRQAMSGALASPTRQPQQVSLAEVEVTEPVILPPPSRASGVGQIAIELRSGIRITVDSAVDAEALSRVIAVLGR